MKILQLTKKFPYPLKDGESIAVTNLSKSLVAHGCKITLLSMNTSKHYVDIDVLPSSYDHYDNIFTVYLDNRVTLSGALANLFSKKSYHVSRFDFVEYRNNLIGILKAENFDIVQLETLYLAPYIETIRDFSDAKIVMRSHNVEFEIWDRVVASTSFLPKRWYLGYLTDKLRNFELGCLSKYDALVTVTKRDLARYQEMGFGGLGLPSPIGVDVNRYLPSKMDTTKFSFSFIGSLDWMPNLDGLMWFMHDIWPHILESYPQVKLHIAGRNTPDSIIKLSNTHIIVHGEVESASDFINDHPITIVPLLSGSGMRVKILEGMALGRVVISTSIGAEGIPAVHQQSILIADTKEAFLECMQWLAEDTSRLVKIGQNARKFIQDNFDERKNASDLVDFYNLLVNPQTP